MRQGDLSANSSTQGRLDIMNDYNYCIRRKVFAFLGAKFHVYDSENRLIGYCHQKAFKLKEDIRCYTDESKQVELINIQARNIIDFSACYDVFDSASGVLLGSWRRKGFSSMFRDKWQLLDCYGNLVAELNEDNAFLALFRRLVSNLLPQEYVLGSPDAPLATYSQFFNPFVFKLAVRLSPQCQFHPYLLLAGGVLLAAIEGRQN